MGMVIFFAGWMYINIVTGIKGIAGWIFHPLFAGISIYFLYLAEKYFLQKINMIAALKYGIATPGRITNIRIPPYTNTENGVMMYRYEFNLPRSSTCSGEVLTNRKIFYYDKNDPVWIVYIPEKYQKANPL